MDNSEKMFELADRLKALRDEKKDAEQRVKAQASSIATNVLSAPSPAVLFHRRCNSQSLWPTWLQNWL